MGSASTPVEEDSEDLEIVFVREPTAEQAALAKELLLPLTFFCYKNESGYTSSDETDGEREVLWSYLLCCTSNDCDLKMEN